MMKIIYVLGFLALSMTFGCKEKKTTETVKIIEVPAPAKDESTKIKIGPDGGSVKTKKVEIEIKDNN